MSSKKKKITSQFKQCLSCNSVLLERDALIHESRCPSSFTNLSHPFIQDKTLYAKFQLFNDADDSLRYIPRDQYDHLMILSNAVLQICEIPLGSFVLVCINGIRFVKRAWRAHDRPLIFAALFEKDSSLSRISPETPLSIRALREKISVAKEIIIELEPFDDDSLVPTFQERFVGRIVNIGTTLTFERYCKIHECKVHDIKSFNCESSSDVEEFFEVVNETVWRIRSEDIIGETTDVTPQRLAGFDFIQDELTYLLQCALGLSVDFPGIFKTRGILLHGPNGTGKTSLLRHCASLWSTNIVHFNNLSVNEVNTQSSILEMCFRHLEVRTPSILIIDDIDTLSNKLRNDNGERFSIALCSIFDKIQQSGKSIVVLAATSVLNRVDKSLRRPGRFDRELEVGVPNPHQRYQILESLLSNTCCEVTPTELKAVADGAHGFVAADLVALVSKASSLVYRTGKSQFDGTELLRSLSLIKPSALREIMVQVPDVRWDDIGGQSGLKHALKQAVEWPLKYADSFERMGIRPPRGVLLYGPPGCSKTMFAKALATESGLNFISVKGPELFSKWVGESEKAIREVFRRARQSSPTIVFFDELDALAAERSGGSGGTQVQERVLAQLLTELDGVEALGHVIFVGATNRPDRIDSALLRPGRLDRVIYVPLPDLQTRQDIFKIQFRKTPTDSDVETRELADLTEGYSGAEVVAVCHEAALNALDEDISTEKVRRCHFISAIEKITPRTPKGALKIYENYNKNG